MLLLTWVMTGRIEKRRMAVIAGAFVVIFFAASLVPIGRQHPLTVSFLGETTTYAGVEAYYGIPQAWVTTFKTYDNATQPLSIVPFNILYVPLMIDLVFWATFSAICINGIFAIRGKKRNSAGLDSRQLEVL